MYRHIWYGLLCTISNKYGLGKWKILEIRKKILNKITLHFINSFLKVI